AGMGGGSSDAATVLMVLNKLWNINLPTSELTKIGLELGADIPFFIFGHNALATGIGEHLTSIELPRTFFVVVKPSFHIPTKNIFGAFAIGNSTIDNSTITPEFLLTTQENDLFSVALKLYPQLKNIANTMSTFGNPAMTGSGSALYLSFTDKKFAKKVAKYLENSYNTYLIESLNKSPIV
ncbi:MAG: 4-(cytidine 5'-diphospho)-2-C-methyl-D-erythritol kinase, partial [Burkholderiales bacterium]|nr:4-(cytidine 5'-diphospho)-2-C-methyl-D-erythritol kinase [Burkholderiales bacterium]